MNEGHHPRILEGIAHSLAISCLSEDEELWGILSELFQNTIPDSEIDVPEERGAQEGLGIALSELLTRSRVPAAKKLIQCAAPESAGVFHIKESLSRFHDASNLD